MASIRNTLIIQKPSVSERINILTQKINAGQIIKPNDIAKKYEAIDLACDELQNQIQSFRAFADEKLLQIKQKANKISKQLKKDNNSIQNSLKQQIANSSQRMMLLIQQQHDLQKESNTKIISFIEQQSKIIGEMIERQSIEKQKESKSISQSLSADIRQIKMVLDEVTLQCKERLQNKQNKLFQRTDIIADRLRHICQTYSDNQSEFYKMLRDLVKKVKVELEEHKTKRQETQTQILNLIDKMCDRTILSKNI